MTRAIGTVDGPIARRGVEYRRAFRRHVHWRTGIGGRISCVERANFGLNRTRFDGLDGARTWCGHSVLRHNLVKIGNLITIDDGDR